MESYFGFSQGPRAGGSRGFACGARQLLAAKCYTPAEHKETIAIQLRVVGKLILRGQAGCCLLAGFESGQVKRASWLPASSRSRFAARRAPCPLCVGSFAWRGPEGLAANSTFKFKYSSHLSRSGPTSKFLASPSQPEVC